MINKNNAIEVLSELDKNLSGFLNEKIDVLCCGGFVALLVLGTRESTNDIDAIFNNDYEEKLILNAAKNVSSQDSGWINGDSKMHEYKTSSDIVLFDGDNIRIKSISIEELLVDRILRPKGMKDLNDSVGMVSYLSEDGLLKSSDVITKIFSVKQIKDSFNKEKIEIFSERFSALCEVVYNNNKDELYNVYPLSVLQNNINEVKKINNKVKRGI